VQLQVGALTVAKGVATHKILAKLHAAHVVSRTEKTSASGVWVHV
jgi:hypothetical protein